MSVNKYKPHVYVIPEDEADRQIADGFILHSRVVSRQVQVVAPAGGWSRVLDTFKEEYVPLLNNKYTHVVLLIDFDGNPDERRNRVVAEVPEELRSRVFVIGPRDQPEALKQALNQSCEAIGTSLANDCADNNAATWAHEHLQHNEDERVRLTNAVRPFLFN